MFIADAQAHTWAASTPERPWPPGRNPPHRPVPVTKDDLLREMDAAGVSRLLIHPPAWEGEYNDLALDAARLHPDRFAVMGRLNINAPSARGKVASWCRQPGMLGLRITFNQGLGNPEDDWVWSEAEAGGVPLMTVALPSQFAAIGRAAERHPGLHITVDHLGVQSKTKDDAAFAHLDYLLPLAKHPNVAVKASGVAFYSTERYPYRNLYPYLRRVYDAFGPRRIFFGSDFTKLSCTYRQAIAIFTEHIPWLTAEDKTWIMGRALCEWTGWKLAA
jgi:predicted TIM-barrel fold metal-dependent hydrolase